MIDLKSLILHLINDIKIPKKRVAELLSCDPKTITRLSERDSLYTVVEMPNYENTMKEGL